MGGGKKKKNNEGAKDGRDSRTTVQLSNLPPDFTKDKLIKLLKKEGFRHDHYNFVYVPISFSSLPDIVNRGYAIVNFVSHVVANQSWNVFQGYKDWGEPCEYSCKVRWWGTQGLGANVDDLKEKSIMHWSVPDYAKPSVWDENGKPMAEWLNDREGDIMAAICDPATASASTYQ